MSRESSSINPSQDRESPPRSRLGQHWQRLREGFTPRYGPDDPSEGAPSKPEHTVPVESSRNYSEDRALDDQLLAPACGTETPEDEDIAPETLEVSGAQLEQDGSRVGEEAEPAAMMEEPSGESSEFGDHKPEDDYLVNVADGMSSGESELATASVGADVDEPTAVGNAESDSESGKSLEGYETSKISAPGEILADTIVGSVHGQDTDSFVDGDDLEEVILEPLSEDGSLEPGVLHMMGDVHYVVMECLPRGYYRGHDELKDETQSVLFHLSPLSHGELWRDVGTSHRMLPEIQYEGEDGHVLEDIQGIPVATGLSLQQALQTLDSVRQLMRFLSVRCRAAVTDICIEGLVLTADHGWKLRYLPVLAPMDEPAHVSSSDGATPIEGSETEKASERTSVFLWGAMLHALVTGEPLSAEGFDINALARLRVPGLPQLLAATLEQQHLCPDLRTLRDICRDFMVPPAPRYMVGAATTVGLNPDRLCNEDSFGVVHSQCEYHDSRPQLIRACIIRACVADGMGGEEAGEVASKAAVDAFCHAVAPANLPEAEEQIRWTRGLGWTANRAVLDALAGSGGGCTLTGVVVVDDRLTLAHVGDSRAYLYSRERGLQLLSRDHSHVKALLDNGLITEDEAAASEDTNQILRALGDGRKDVLAEEYVDTLAGLKDPAGGSVHGETLDLHVGDLVLLMSDGIWGSWEYRESVISTELSQVITEADCEPQRVADSLVQAALDAGADDNATVVVLKRVG